MSDIRASAAPFVTCFDRKSRDESVQAGVVNPTLTGPTLNETYIAAGEAAVFLIRTDRSAHGTTCASAALTYVKEMQDAGHRVVVTRLGGRRVSQLELRREVKATGTAVKH